MEKIARRNSMSMSRLACLLLCGAFTSSCLGGESADSVCAEGAVAAEKANYERAMNIWAEESFDASARLRLRAVIDCLASSEIAPDDESAAKWIFARAEEGNVQAALYAGLLYGSGVGVEADLDASIDWLGRAADKGSEAAMYIGEKLKVYVEETKNK